MKHEIFMLDEATIGKIAAGEVVERPVSVIKELIENSIDAGAKNIVVEIKDGGKTYIRVTDDGIGIPESQLSKVFLRHSTSKIKKIEDLYELQTCGFRGEALSSVAAVSKTTLITKTSDEELGNRVLLEGGKEISSEKTGAQVGTTLIVEDIFFNVPARKKFMRSSQSEMMAINQMVLRLAIGHCEIRFKLISNGKVLLSTIGDGKLNNVIRSVYGKNAIEQMFYVEQHYTEEEVSIRGYLVKTSMYQANRRMQNLFFNGRYIEDFSIVRAVEDAYKWLIPIGKFPAFVLFFEVNPSKVDFNVHPNKLNIKYDAQMRLEDKAYAFVRDSLLAKSANMIPKGNFVKEIQSEKSTKEFVQIPLNVPKGNLPFIGKQEQKKETAFFWKDEKKKDFFNESDTREILSQTKNDSIVSLNAEKKNLAECGLERKHTFWEEQVCEQEGKYSDEKSFSNNQREFNLENHFSGKDTVRNHELQDNETEAVCERQSEHFYLKKEEETLLHHGSNKDIEQNESDVVDYEQLHYAGRVFSTYIIMTKEEKMYLVDQHAAHERVLFERYMSMVEKNNISSQQLLEHILIELSYENSQLIEQYMDELRKMGFDLDFFGERVIALRGVPVMFNKNQSQQFIYEVLELLQNDKQIQNHDDFIDKVATKACRAAIKANDRMSETEAMALLKNLNQCANKYTCPHGRPIFIEVKKYDLEKMFKRVNA